jgi:hypothetical protein
MKPPSHTIPAVPAIVSSADIRICHHGASPIANRAGIVTGAVNGMNVSTRKKTLTLVPNTAVEVST